MPYFFAVGIFRIKGKNKKNLGATRPEQLLFFLY
jgi:hypothetical protein